MYKILLVEDEKNFASVLKEYLKMNGFNVQLCENGEEALEAFRKEKFDLCILDIMMPKKDGFTLSTELKAIHKNIPIVFLTARSMREDIIKGYKLGADDYIVKPFDSEVLLLKIKVVLDRNLNQLNTASQIHQLGQFNFDTKLRSLKTEQGVELKLSPKEAALLDLLCQSKNTVLTREKALTQIWKEDTYFTARSMDVYIVKLRKYLEPDKAITIENIHGSGYSLICK